MDQILQIAALACAAVIFVLMVASVARVPLTRWAQTFRFRRSLKRLDAVADRWAMEIAPRPRRRPDEIASDPLRRPRHPEGDA